jgi:hypothetical protein
MPDTYENLGKKINANRPANKQLVFDLMDDNEEIGAKSPIKFTCPIHGEQSHVRYSVAKTKDIYCRDCDSNYTTKFQSYCIKALARQKHQNYRLYDQPDPQMGYEGFKGSGSSPNRTIKKQIKVKCLNNHNGTGSYKYLTDAAAFLKGSGCRKCNQN